jgi:hypothetical protein
MPSMASITGWLALAAMLLAALVPVAYRLRFHKRAAFASPPVKLHVAIGMTAAALGALHPLTALFALGSPEAVGAGVFGIGLGGLAFVVLLSHAGIGLKLREPKLKTRAESRRRHTITAVVLSALGIAHALALWLE